MPPARTMFEKVWDDHVVADLGQDTCLIHIDRHFLHELSGTMSFKELDDPPRPVRHPELTFATLDHVIETLPGRGYTTRIPGGDGFISGLREGTRKHGLRLFDLEHPYQGIVHVVSPELGIALPGTTLVCGDSHTCTVGGVGALAWGIGSTEGGHVLATQTLLLTRPQTMRVNFEGTLPTHVSAKDLVLHLIGRISADGGNGYAVEYAGSAVRALGVEGRLTLCNMGIEFSARMTFVAPDDTTLSYLAGRPFAPKGRAWEQAAAYWRALPSDRGARFDREVRIDCSGLAPQVTWGTSPEQETGVDGHVPDPARAADPVARQGMERALSYMGLQPGQALAGLPIEGAFIGSCTNSRLDDLRAAAAVLKGGRVPAGVKAICTPGSTQVKRAAEAEGIDRIFRAAGFEWRESGCSFCMSGGVKGEGFGVQQRVVSTTNRNFEGRQGPGVRSHLASPVTVAASALAGRIADVRHLRA